MVKPGEGKKVYVGLSGGVDSSVSAALLKEAGYDVRGVFIKVWQPDFFPCTATEDRLDAMRVCAALNIPFETLDVEEVYKREVVDYMVREYEVGRTPNPDVMCNQSVKFGAFLDYALSKGADFVATGHYAKVRKVGSGPKDTFELRAGTDSEKDQSYFLWTLTQRELKHVLFPVGHLLKSEVRKLADTYKLPTATKKDSQGLCFLGKLDMKEFLSHFISSKRGDVLNEKGEVIGTHEGALFYVLGERHGFSVHKSGGTPYYLIGKDVEKNTITVAPQHRVEESATRDVELTNVNVVREEIRKGDMFMARSRYRQPLVRVLVTEVRGDRARVTFQEEAPLSPSGQSLVLYKQEGSELICLGGGIIS